MVKLRFEREKPRESGEGFILVAQETDVEVHAAEGLEIFKFQVRRPAGRIDVPTPSLTVVLAFVMSASILCRARPYHY